MNQPSSRHRREHISSKQELSLQSESHVCTPCLLWLIWLVAKRIALRRIAKRREKRRGTEREEKKAHQARVEKTGLVVILNEIQWPIHAPLSRLLQIELVGVFILYLHWYSSAVGVNKMLRDVMMRLWSIVLLGVAVTSDDIRQLGSFSLVTDDFVNNIGTLSAPASINWVLCRRRHRVSFRDWAVAWALMDWVGSYLVSQNGFSRPSWTILSIYLPISIAW